MITILESLEKWSKIQPEKMAWTFLNDKGDPVDSYSYKELEFTTDFIANSLIQNNKLSKGDRVLLVFFPGLDFTISLLSCFKAGLIAVPVFPPDPRRLKKDLDHFVNIQSNSGSNVVLTNSQYNFVKKVENLKNIFSTENTKWPNLSWIPVDDLIKKGKSNSNINVKSSLPSLNRDDIAFLQYTSGSTSDPKGVMISHNNLAHNLLLIIHDLAADINTTNVSWLPQYHDMGLIGSYLGCVYCGGKGYYLSPISFLKDPTVWVRSISRFKGTHTQAPNFAYALVSRKFKENEKFKKEKLDLSSLQHMINAAEPVDYQAIKEFYHTFSSHGLPNKVVIPTYGLAEHTVFVCSGGKQVLVVTKSSLELNKIEVINKKELEYKELNDDDGDNDADNNYQTIVGCGYKQESVDIIIVDHENSIQINENGSIGEIWVTSESKAMGYWGLSDLSKHDFHATLNSNNKNSDSNENDVINSKEYLRTGDLGFIYNNELFVCGRLKDLIIVRGTNHYPQDIERSAELSASAFLRPGCSAAFSVKPSDASTEIVIYIAELKEGINSNQYPSIVDTCKKTIAAAHGVSLSTICLLRTRSINKTTSGKIARSWCRKAFLAGTLDVLFRWDGQVNNNNESDVSDLLVGEDPNNCNRADGYSPVVTDDNNESNPKDNNGVPVESVTTQPMTLEEVRTSTVEELLVKLEFVLIQISSQGPSELKSPVDRNAALISLGLDSMTIVQFKGVLENRYFCDIPDDYLFTQLATLTELAGIVKVGSLTNEQKHKFESLQTNKESNKNEHNNSNSAEIVNYKQPLCPWFTCCY